MDKESINSQNAIEPKRLLVVDDERAIADLVKGIFVAEGIEVDAFTNPLDALEAFETTEYDLAIVDIMMPMMDGFELCTRLRNITDTPIVFLSAKDQEADVVVGLTLGADDYIAKPFKPRELVARVKAHLRRREMSLASSEQPESESLQCRGLEVNPKSHEASMHDVPLQLTPKEFGILAALMRRTGEPVSAKELYEEVWQETADSCSPNTIMVHIRHLRSKIAAIDSSVNIIETAWGVGYRIPS